MRVKNFHIPVYEQMWNFVKKTNKPFIRNFICSIFFHYCFSNLHSLHQHKTNYTLHY